MTPVEVVCRLAVKLLVILAVCRAAAAPRACACVLAYVRVRARYWETLVFPDGLSFPLALFSIEGCRGEVLFSLPLSFDMPRGVVDNC